MQIAITGQSRCKKILRIICLNKQQAYFWNAHKKVLLDFIPDRKLTLLNVEASFCSRTWTKLSVVKMPGSSVHWSYTITSQVSSVSTWQVWLNSSRIWTCTNYVPAKDNKTKLHIDCSSQNNKQTANGNGESVMILFFKHLSIVNAVSHMANIKYYLKLLLSLSHMCTFLFKRSQDPKSKTLWWIAVSCFEI